MNTVAPYTFASLYSIFSRTYPSKNGVNGYYNIYDDNLELVKIYKKKLIDHFSKNQIHYNFNID